MFGMQSTLRILSFLSLCWWLDDYCSQNTQANLSTNGYSYDWSQSGRSHRHPGSTINKLLSHSHIIVAHLWLPASGEPGFFDVRENQDSLELPSGSQPRHRAPPSSGESELPSFSFWGVIRLKIDKLPYLRWFGIGRQLFQFILSKLFSRRSYHLLAKIERNWNVFCFMNDWVFIHDLWINRYYIAICLGELSHPSSSLNLGLELLSSVWSSSTGSLKSITTNLPFLISISAKLHNTIPNILYSESARSLVQPW